MTEWQPIETAPRDGTRILAFGRRGKKTVYEVTWWRQPKDGAGYIGWGEFNERFWPATHWQPLSPAPALTSQDRKATT